MVWLKISFDQTVSNLHFHWTSVAEGFSQPEQQDDPGAPYQWVCCQFRSISRWLPNQLYLENLQMVVDFPPTLKLGVIV